MKLSSRLLLLMLLMLRAVAAMVLVAVTTVRLWFTSGVLVTALSSGSVAAVMVSSAGGGGLPRGRPHFRRRLMLACRQATGDKSAKDRYVSCLCSRGLLAGAGGVEDCAAQEQK